MTTDTRTTIAQRIEEADVALDAINGDLVADMNLYSLIRAVTALRLAVRDIADVLAALDPAEQPIGHVPTPAGLSYLAVRRQQHPAGEHR